MFDPVTRARSITAAPAVLVVLLAACQGADSGTSSAAGGPSSAPPESAAASAAASEAVSAPSSGPTDSATGEGVVRVADSALGKILTDADGMSLYLFTNDSDGVSACAGDCAAAWPPLTVESAADAVAGDGVTGAIGTIERDDGTLQVTIGGAPLYLYAADAEPGDLAGHQVGGVWFAVTPDGEAAGEEAGQGDSEY